MEIFQLLLVVYASRLHAFTERGDDGFFGEYTVVNQGRMYGHTVLMVIEEIDLEECIFYCIRHRKCVTVSYGHTVRLCELNNMEFDDIETDTEASDWLNYGTPPKVDGDWGKWSEFSNCSVQCGNGTQLRSRSCDSPPASNGGLNCVTLKMERQTEEYETRMCYIGCPLVCYGARDNDYGEFTIPSTGDIVGIRLIHESGYVRCGPSESFNSRWGCGYHNMFLTYIADQNKNILFPDKSRIDADYGVYNLPGYSPQDQDIVLTPAGTMLYAKEGKKLRIWYSEDFFDSFEHDNSGRHCVFVKFIYQ